MNYPLPEAAAAYVRSHTDELIELIKTLVQVPSPSNHEERRAEVCRQWLEDNGCHGAYVDASSSVIYPYHCEDGKPLVAFLAHIDTVFPDDEIPLREENGRIYAPGVGDDTANLATLLMIARFVTEQGYEGPYGLLFVGNSGEEGLGNLRGSRSIVETFGDRIYNFIGMDGGLGHCTVNSVGSQRYRVTVRTEGGHSYGDFGNRNAAHYLASMIVTLYAMKAPDKAKTTYNVGGLSGGTSVNTIPSEASMLYEFRSCDRDCLKQMETMFLGVIESYRNMGIEVDVEVLGIRPCKGEVDAAEQQKLWDRVVEIVSRYYDGEIDYDVNSTDANIPWAAGIPATTIGTIVCGAAHTYGEWMDIASVESGFMTAMNLVLSYCDCCN